jgi:GNAT superfamily N-acetyltransferase
MSIEPLVSDDLLFIPLLQPEGWQDISSAILYYTQHPHCFPVKAVIDHKMAGIGCGIIHDDIAWVAHIIVHTAHRNKGVGFEITKAVMDIVMTKGCKTLNLIATDLGAPVYKKLGFVTEETYCFFKELPSLEVSTDANIVPFQSTFEKDVVSLDDLASAEHRMVDLKDHLQDGFVYQEEKVITGFYLPTIGDGLIVAKSEKAGKALMKARLRDKNHGSFPMSNKIALKFMH